MDIWELSAREAIRDSLVQYTHSGDRRLTDELGGAFCEDGVLEIKGSAPVVGRAAIVARLGGGRGGPPAAAPAPNAAGEVKRMVRHHVVNVRFEALTPEEATVTSYFMVVNQHGLDHIGKYFDTFVPVGDRWLIKLRLVSVDWSKGPDAMIQPTPARLAQL